MQKEDNFTDLRRRAESDARTASELSQEALSKLSAEEIKNLVHELYIHKIELQLQNEELVRAQAALEASFQHYTELYDFAPVGYFTLDIKGTILEANLTAARQLNVAKSDLIGQPFAHFVVWDDRDNFYIYQRQLDRVEARTSIQIRMERNDDALFHARLDGKVWEKKDLPARCQLAMSDITGLKQTKEALQQTLQEKDILMAELQHRIRNTLNLVANILYFEMQNLPDQRSRLIFDKVQSRIYSLSDVYKLLYQQDRISSIDMGKYVQDLTETLSTSFAPVDGRVKIATQIQKIELDLKKALPLGLILNELLTNAFKYAFQPDIAGEIMVKLFKNDNGAVICVNDNGIGVSESTICESQGFGLDMVKSMVAQIGGNFTLEGNNGVSACVTFALDEEE